MADPLVDQVQTKQNNSIAVGKTNRDSTVAGNHAKRDAQHVALAVPGQKLIQPDWVKT
jgi:hypothetical protein